jgi:putative transposase
VNWKERKSVAADLRLVYRAPTAERAEAALAEFRRKYPKHQVVADVWERSWHREVPFAPEIRVRSCLVA